MRILVKKLVNLIFICFTFLRRIKKTKNTSKTILLLEIMGIGDVVCHTPFIKQVQASGRYHIIGCFPPHVIPLQKKICPVNDYIPYSGLAKTVKFIREKKCDLVVVNAWGLRHSAIALLSGLPFVGYINDYTCKMSYINDYYFESVGVPRSLKKIRYSSLHLAQRGNPVLQYLGLQEVTNRLIKSQGRSLQSDYVVIHAGADFAGRQWPVKNFREFVTFLLKTEYKNVKRVYLVGGREDRVINASITEGLQQCVNVAGEMSLVETFELLVDARMFIGNDSGPLHMAVFAQTPVIGLYGPNLPEISGPFTDDSITLFNKYPCCPCNQRNCKYHYRCINSISVKDVVNAFQKLEGVNEED
jgi:ADP-heptose:LPS heptosyltransferase